MRRELRSQDLLKFSYDILYYFIIKIIYLYHGSIALTLDRFLLHTW